MAPRVSQKPPVLINLCLLEPIIATLTERAKDDEWECVPQKELQHTADDHQDTTHEVVSAALRCQPTEKVGG